MSTNESAALAITEATRQYHLGDRRGCLETLNLLKESEAGAFKHAEACDKTGDIQPEAITWCFWVQLAINKLKRDLGVDPNSFATTAAHTCLTIAKQRLNKIPANPENTTTRIQNPFDSEYFNRITQIPFF